MLNIQTKLTSQGQVSVPAAVRNLLGLTPGTALQWIEENGHIVVKRAVRHDSLEVHAALFQSESPVLKTLAEIKDGIRQSARRRHARS